MEYFNHSMKFFFWKFKGVEVRILFSTTLSINRSYFTNTPLRSNTCIFYNQLDQTLPKSRRVPVEYTREAYAHKERKGHTQIA